MQIPCGRPDQSPAETLVQKYYYFVVYRDDLFLRASSRAAQTATPMSARSRRLSRSLQFLQQVGVEITEPFPKPGNSDITEVGHSRSIN